MTDKKSYISLQPSESAVFQSAANIYAAYIIAGKVPDGEETAWMEKSIRQSIKMAKATDATLVSDDELDA